MEWKIPRRFTAVNRIWTMKPMSETEENNGLTHHDDATIYLRKGMSGALRHHKFIHEVLHVVEHAIGMKMNHKQLDAAAGVIHQILNTAEGDYDAENR